MASYSSMFGSMLTFVIFLGGKGGMLSFCLLCVVVMFGPVSRVFFFHFFELKNDLIGDCVPWVRSGT